ncbi:Glycoside hydrolase family 76 [Neofusicoccum parvum]|uniref:Glycoside hydrolase family 76 n=1 Tax=Neofusicoccum parvum TaxID=310453 RepID=A0ACB5RQU6_9PEZI|nr:Glycoside hydrolase family 76 [Neofusicoccum parvum]
MPSFFLCPAVLALSAAVHALDLPTNDADALSLAVKQVSNGVLTFYDRDSNETQDGIGIFPDPYYWWESGVAWDSLVNYWYLTGDASHNELVQSALIAQTGTDDDFMPLNQTKSLANDDQAAWGLAAMTAAERDFPTTGNQTAWIDLARNVFDTQAARWDTGSCGGGLRWQIFTFNAGYNYKNSISQAMFFQLAARLAHFTGNQTYVDWASRAYDWTSSVGLISENFMVYDGTSVTQNCTEFSRIQWSYNAAAFVYGSAILANVTSDTQWTDRTNSLLSSLLTTFFPNTTSQIITERACESSGTCNPDQLVMPALTLRWLALTPLFAPTTQASIYPALNASAAAAASRCTVVDGQGPDAPANCRGRWSASGNDTSSADDENTGTDDDTWGLGQQLAALEVLQSKYVVTPDGVNASFALRTENGTAMAGGGNGTATGGSGASGTAGASGAGRLAASWGALVTVAAVGAWFL